MSRPPPSAARYPGHRWGFLANDPWDPEVDRAVGDAWERAVQLARAARGASQRHQAADTERGDAAGRE